MCGSLSSDGSMCVLSVGHDGYHATVTEPIETSAGGCFWWDITSAQRDQDQSYASAGLGRAVTKAVQLVHSRNVAAGWWSDPKTGERKDRNVGELLCLVHSEISEAMEGHRKGLMDDKLPHRPMIEVELADAVIRILDMAGGLGLDLGGAVAEKLEVNRHRADHKPENRVKAGGKAY